MTIWIVVGAAIVAAGIVQFVLSRLVSRCKRTSASE
jgi:hypothetical protein